MRAAIYCRYSTDTQNATSIAGQEANCRVIADRECWSIVEVYSDAAMGGNDDNRPQYQRMLSDAELEKFDCIVVDETSRLTRSPGELPRLLQQLQFRNQFVVDAKGFDSRSETGMLLASIYSGIDNLELQKIRSRTHRGLRERAKSGHWTGGKVYGYQTKQAGDRRKLVIDLEQAAIVREIFARYADGESPKSIANDLNRRRIPSPGSTWKRTQRRNRGWMHTAIVGSAKTYSGILRNELYNGRHVWNRRKSKVVPGTKRRLYEMRPRSEWITEEHPELRIVDELLWQRVQIRLKETRKRVSRRQERPRGRPTRYLLSGILKCGTCGANFIMRDTRRYCCSSHTNGGKHLCSNDLTVPREVAEDALLSGIENRLLQDDVLEIVEQRVRNMIDDHNRSVSTSGVKPLENQLRNVEAQLGRIVEAIATTGGTGALYQKLEELEAEKTTLMGEVEAARSKVDARISVVDVLPSLFDEWRSFVGGLRSLGDNKFAAPEDVQFARERLHHLLGDVVVKPKDGVLWAHVGLNARGLTDVRPQGASINREFLVAGAGFEPATFGL